jgi:hypothetical protein
MNRPYLSRVLLCGLWLLLATMAVSAQRTSAQPRLKVRGRGRTITLYVNGRAHRLSLGDKLDAAALEDVSLVFVSHRSDFTYLLIDACGMSKRIPDGRMCGAGTECNLVWLKLDGAWRVAEARSAHYQSCWSTIENEEFAIKGRVLSFEYKDFHLARKTRLTYDADQPERGFVLEESAFDPNKPN